MAVHVQELTSSVHSVDAHGRVCLVDGAVRRAVSAELHGALLALAGRGGLERLHGAGLVRTQVLPAGAMGSEGLGEHQLEHERLPFVSYPQEWTLPMLRDAGVCTLEMAIALQREGLALYDAHPYNVTFRHGRPVFLDASSIRAGGVMEKWWPEEFFSSFYAPVRLRSINPLRRYLWPVAQLVAHSEHHFADFDSPRALARTLAGRKRFGRLAWGYWRRAKGFKAGRNDRERTIAYLSDLRDRLAGLSFPKRRSEWGGYKEPGGRYDQPESYSPKARAVETLLRRLPPGRLTDLACSKGWFAGLAATMGHTALGVEIDANAVEAARPLAAERRIDIACMNVIWPTPPQGRALSYPSALERFACDTLLMIALMHHLVLRQGVSFRSLAAMAAAYGPRNLIIEWIPRDDVYVKNWPTEMGVSIPDWYTEENFVAALRAHFPKVDKVPSGEGHTEFRGPTSRVMYLFQR
ncbi:MAG: hypothetical protein LW650_11630 [Planctomycetaceae bacterium]|jgi:hypothetical protein|nr:hypothetical protein [Phycisphaerales bacterium]MCE2654083.1 hypothetical protein [Planctomycetaceae bacterium]